MKTLDKQQTDQVNQLKLSRKEKVSLLVSDLVKPIEVVHW